MLTLPLFRYTSRARSTSWTIALCTMFIVASFSVAAGLQTSMDTLMDNFSSEYYVVTEPSGAGPILFDQQDVLSIVDEAAFGLLCLADASPGLGGVTAFCVVDGEGVMNEALSTDGSNALAGTELAFSGELLLSADREVMVTVVGKYSSSFLPPHWLLCSEETMRMLLAADDGEFNFAVVKELTEQEMESLLNAGFVVQPMIAILEFLQSGANELRSDALLVLLPSSFVVGVLVYSFLGSEVVDRRREIGILKTIGAGRQRIFSYLLMNSLIITAWGAALGLALGIILSYGIAALASHMFTSVFVIEIQESLLLIAFVATLAAGLVGTMIPAIRSTITSPVDDLRVVGRF